MSTFFSDVDLDFHGSASGTCLEADADPAYLIYSKIIVIIAQCVNNSTHFTVKAKTKGKF